MVAIQEGAVLIEDREQVRVLRLSRPGRSNSWGDDIGSQLLAALAEAQSDSDIRAVVITGDGDKAFSSGADLGNKDAHSRSIGGALGRIHSGTHPTFGTLLEFEKPVVAAVNGYAIGAGFLLTLCCDVIVASPTAVFALPQVSLGILPGFGGILRLAQYIGRGRAMEIALSGRRVDAQEAAAIGLVSKVTAPGEHIEEAVDYAARLGAMPPLSVKMAKESVYLGLELGQLRLAATTDVYRSMCLGATSDIREAHDAWANKRTPVYKGE